MRTMRMMPAAIYAHPPDAPNRVKERRSRSGTP